MKVLVKGKNIEISEALREHAEKKAGKIVRFFTAEPLNAQITMSAERGMHIAEVTVQFKELLLRGEAKTSDMYASIDEAIERIERQILKYKTKINRRLHLDDAVVAGPVPGVEEVLEEPRIVRTKRFAFKPMSVSEAIMQMELLGHDFYVFANADSEEVNVVYRRRDGHYGLIEPQF
ncbi:MAG: ribosome hibernation-promoting factor, HPF/YfiA family [Patescibacteria group bacterium]